MEKKNKFLLLIIFIVLFLLTAGVVINLTKICIDYGGSHCKDPMYVSFIVISAIADVLFLGISLIIARSIDKDNNPEWYGIHIYHGDGV